MGGPSSPDVWLTWLTRQSILGAEKSEASVAIGTAKAWADCYRIKWLEAEKASLDRIRTNQEYLARMRRVEDKVEKAEREARVACAALAPAKARNDKLHARIVDLQDQLGRFPDAALVRSQTIALAEQADAVENLKRALTAKKREVKALEDQAQKDRYWSKAEVENLERSLTAAKRESDRWQDNYERRSEEVDALQERVDILQHELLAAKREAEAVVKDEDTVLYQLARYLDKQPAQLNSLASACPMLRAWLQSTAEKRRLSAALNKLTGPELDAVREHFTKTKEDA